MTRLVHRKYIQHILLAATALVLVCTGCESDGDNPIGSMVTRTSLSIQYWTITSRQLAGSNIKCIGLDYDQRVYASIQDSAVFRSDDGGASWTNVNEGLPSHNTVHSLELGRNGIMYASNDTAVFRRTSAGSTWEQLPAPWPENTQVFGLRADASMFIYAKTSYGLYQLNEAGDDWTHIVSGLPFGLPITDVEFLSNGQAAALASNGKIYVSSNGTTGWSDIYIPYYVDSVYSIAYSPMGDLCILLKSRQLILYKSELFVEPELLLFAEEIRFYNGAGFLIQAQKKSRDPYSNEINRYHLMRSMDGGMNWAPMYSPIPSYVVDLTFDAAGNGYAACADGTIFTTIVPILP